MHALDGTQIRAERFIRKLRGGSQPVLVEGSDGLLYVLKFLNNSQGTNLLFNESMGTELFRACALPVALWKPIVLSRQFIDGSPGCWMDSEQGKVRPQAGICFGSMFVGQQRTRLLQILPRANFGRIRNRDSFWLAWLVDLCCEHTDTRQAVFVEGRNGRLDPWFVDMGHLFGGPDGSRKARGVLRCRYPDQRIYPEMLPTTSSEYLTTIGSLDMDALWTTTRKLPADWTSAKALRAFFRGLETLSNANLVRNLLEVLADTQESRSPLVIEGAPQALRMRICQTGVELGTGLQMAEAKRITRGF